MTLLTPPHEKGVPSQGTPLAAYSMLDGTAKGSPVYGILYSNAVREKLNGKSLSNIHQITVDNTKL
jgi:hypothetical protein